MLAMGLLIEACEGGIRKDYVTLSYLFPDFVTQKTCIL